MAKSRTVRRIALWTVFAVAVAMVLVWRASAGMSETEVDSMLRGGELIGLSLDEAGRKLGHTTPETEDGIVLFDQFRGSEAWLRRAVEVEVTDGRVTDAGWATPQDP